MAVDPSTDRKLQQLLQEHEELRREILHQDTTAIQILAAVLVLDAAILTIAFSVAIEQDWMKGLLFFCAQAVAMFGLAQRVDRQRSVFIISSYLRVFNEADPDLRHLRWETRLGSFYEHPSGKRLGRYLGAQRYTYGLLILLNAVLGLVYTLKDTPASWWDGAAVSWVWETEISGHSLAEVSMHTFVIIAVLAFGVGLIVLASRYWSAFLQQLSRSEPAPDFLDVWRDVKSAEDGKAAADAKKIAPTNSPPSP